MLNNKILLLLGILTFTGATAQIEEIFSLNLNKFNLTDFGIKGKVKSITTSFFKYDEREKKPNAWKTIILHHNFDENGKLISEYGVNHDFDTCEITFYSYNEANLIREVKKYETGFWGEYVTSDFRNWKISLATFEYDNIGNKTKMIIIENEISKTTLYEYNSKNKIIKLVNLDNTSETNSSLDKSEYIYNKKGLLIKTITKNEFQPEISGETTYNYENEKIISETFTRFDGEQGYSIFYEKGKANRFNGTDTLTNYSKSVFNDRGEIIKAFNHFDRDGEFKSHTHYSYIYDDNNNIIEKYTDHFDEIVLRLDFLSVYHYETKYKITYY